jgi:hypothetical protein
MSVARIAASEAPAHEEACRIAVQARWTYYGQWLRKNRLFTGLESRPIAHNDTWERGIPVPSRLMIAHSLGITSKTAPGFAFRKKEKIRCDVLLGSFRAR